MNLYGSVRAADNTGSGSATVKLTFDGWDAGRVAATTHGIQVMPAKAGPKEEAVSEFLTATLPHPDRKANVSTAKYSDDGKTLFAAGYPSGVIQFWDVAEKRESHRVESPKGRRGTWNYALLSPDWKTLYVPTEERKVTPVEKDGKQVYRIEFVGTIRRWDLVARKELEPFVPPKDHGNQYAELSPDGRFIVSVERRTYDTSTRADTSLTVRWDIAAGKRTVVGDGFRVPKFAKDGRRIAMTNIDYESKSTAVTVGRFPDDDDPAKWTYAGKDERTASVAGFSPDGSLLAVALGGKKGAEPTTLFLDATTLKEQARWTGTADPEGYGWETGTFAPDGKRYAIFDGNGVVHVWDVAAKKAVRTVSLGDGGKWIRKLEFGPDGRWLAVAWMPKGETSDVREPDVQDLPQPRMTLIDLANAEAKPTTMIAPHGFVGGLAFRPDGRQLALGSSGGIHLFDLSKLTGK